MTKEETIEAFEQELLPEIKEASVKILNYLEEKNLPSSYKVCLGSYLENFFSFNARPWKEHCEGYGVKMEFIEIQKELDVVCSLDEYVEEFR